MSTTIEIKLQSSFRKHGSSGAAPTKVHSAASSKLNAVLSKLDKTLKPESQGKANEVNTSDEVTKSPSVAKPYGSHNGNIHVHTFKVFTIGDDGIVDPKISNYVANLTSHLEGRHSFDLKAAKHAYRTFKDDTTAKFAETYGTQLSTETTTKLLNTLATKAFKYTQHQIVIVVRSDQEIEGGRKSEDGTWVLIIKSKMVFTEGRTLLSDADIKAMAGLSETEVKLRVSLETRIPAMLLWDAQAERWVVSYRSSGSITVFDSY